MNLTKIEEHKIETERYSVILTIGRCKEIIEERFGGIEGEIMGRY